MFTKKELSYINNQYFKLIRYVADENFIEFQSKCSKDYWIIKKTSFLCDYPVIIYHKHPGQPYYHRHWQCYKVVQSVKSIKSHDQYQRLRKWNQ